MKNIYVMTGVEIRYKVSTESFSKVLPKKEIKKLGLSDKEIPKRIGQTKTKIEKEKINSNEEIIWVNTITKIK